MKTLINIVKLSATRVAASSRILSGRSGSFSGSTVTRIIISKSSSEELKKPEGIVTTALPSIMSVVTSITSWILYSSMRCFPRQLLVGFFCRDRQGSKTWMYQAPDKAWLSFYLF